MVNNDLLLLLRFSKFFLCVMVLLVTSGCCRDLDDGSELLDKVVVKERFFTR